MGDNPKSRHLRYARDRARRTDTVSYAGSGGVAPQAIQASFPGMDSSGTPDLPDEESSLELDGLLVQARAQERETRRERITAERDYADARKALARTLRELGRRDDEETRALFTADRGFLDAQRAEVRRLAEESREAMRILQGEVARLQQRIAEATKHSPYELTILRGELSNLMPLVSEAAKEAGAQRRELVSIAEDLRWLAEAKRIDAQERQVYRQELAEMDRRLAEDAAFQRECRCRDAAWEREYRRRSDAEERASVASMGDGQR